MAAVPPPPGIPHHARAMATTFLATLLAIAILLATRHRRASPLAWRRLASPRLSAAALLLDHHVDDVAVLHVELACGRATPSQPSERRGQGWAAPPRPAPLRESDSHAAGCRQTESEPPRSSAPGGCSTRSSTWSAASSFCTARAAIVHRGRQACGWTEVGRLWGELANPELP